MRPYWPKCNEYKGLLFDHEEATMDLFSPVCSECGQWLIATSAGFCSCPDGHGRLIPRPHGFHSLIHAARRAEWLERLPGATYIGRASRKHVFRIHGRDERFIFSKGRGRAQMLETEGVAMLRNKPRRFVALTAGGDQ